MRKITIYFLILVLHGCATFKESVEVTHIKEGDTVIVGKLTLMRQLYLSGRPVSQEVAPSKKLSIALKSFNSVQDIPNVYSGYAGVTRLFVDESGNLLVPIQPANYFLVDVHSPSPGFVGRYTHQEFSRGSGFLGTLEINVKEGVANYIGHLQIIEAGENYEDSNKDGYIDAKEFKSSITNFEEVSAGKEKIPKEYFWSAYAVFIVDESSEVSFPFTIQKNLAKFVKF